jgi:hypothetical protein
VVNTAPDYVPHWAGNHSTAAEELSRWHNLAQGYECPYCSAGIGEPCRNPRTGAPLSWRLPAHNDRLRYAESGYLPRRTQHADPDDTGE